MLNYDPDHAPDPGDWLALDVAERLECVSVHHRSILVKLPNARLHAVIHVVVENQLAEGIEGVRETLERLKGEGLDRHEAIHAIGSVLAGHLASLIREGVKAPDPNEPYFQGLRSLTASSWMKGTS